MLHLDIFLKKMFFNSVLWFNLFCKKVTSVKYDVCENIFIPRCWTRDSLIGGCLLSMTDKSRYAIKYLALAP